MVRLHVVKDGQELRLAFLRPAALVGHLSAGDTVHLDIFELQVKGPARVLGVDPCPPLEEGAGRLVTGTAVSDSVEVLRIKLAGLAEPLEVTGNHPVFSEDHQDFVSAKVLRPGDRLRTADGAGTVVEAVERLVGRYDVHNLEVDGAHQYYVTGLDVLVHNVGENGLLGLPEGPAPELPAFNGKTSGILVPQEPAGLSPVAFQSQNITGARYPYVLAEGHVETQAAQWMADNGVTRATVYHNNPFGTCPNCDAYVPTYLQENSILNVVPPEGAVAKTPRWVDYPNQYRGNFRSPYP